jgi:mannosyltransferase OCH1-like enzyme
MSKPIQLRNPSPELRARLQESSKRNFRSLAQEAEARLEFSFDIEEALQTRVHQAWIDEALKAGTMRPGSVQRLRALAQRARENAR